MKTHFNIYFKTKGKQAMKAYENTKYIVNVLWEKLNFGKHIIIDLKSKAHFIAT